jgi:hypothetical protein
VRFNKEIDWRKGKTTTSHSFAIVLNCCCCFFVGIGEQASAAKDQDFRCGDYGGEFGFHCDPSFYPLTSFAERANRSEILPVTNTDPVYVQGVTGKAVELKASHIEYIEIEDNHHLYDYGNFSVSFWIKQLFDPSGVAQVGSYE